MRDTDKQAFVKLMIVTMKLYEKQVDREVIDVWWNIFSKYEFDQVRQAFSIHIEQDKFAPRPASITAILIKPVPDGRPSSDEAWAVIPRDENTSVVMTEEMAEAYGIAKPLLDVNDQIAARMSFKAAYERIVEANRRDGIEPIWFPSLGHDKGGRDQAITEAVRMGRLSAEHMKSIAVKPEIMAIEDKTDMSPEKVKANLARLKMLLNSKTARQAEAA